MSALYNLMTKILLSDWVISQVIKPSDASSNLMFGSQLHVDGEIAAVGSTRYFSVQKVFVYNVTVNPAQEMAILTIPDSTGDDRFGWQAIAISREYGILVGAHNHKIAGMLYLRWFSCRLVVTYNTVVEQPPCMWWWWWSHTWDTLV